jgi:hypothetical protein
MSDLKKESIATEIKRKIKVKLDSKTIITLSDMAKLAFWKERYPKAVILD